MNRQINPKRISPVFFAIVYLWSVVSCNSPENIVADDAPAYRAYMEHNNTLFNAGIFTNQRVFIRKIDSFHASRKTHSPHAIALMHLDASRYYFELREIDSATIRIDSALFFAQKYNIDQTFASDYIDILSSKGKILYATNRFTQAYNYYYKAKKFAEHEKDTCSFQLFTYGLAMIAYKQKKYHEAADYFKKSYLSASQCPDPFAYQLQEDLDNIALCYEKLGLYDSAIYYYDSAISLIKSNPRAFNLPLQKEKPLGVIYGNMGGVMLAQGKPDTAIELLKKSFAINIRPRYENTDAVLTHIKLARAYLLKNDMGLLQKALLDIRAELDSIHHPLEAEASWKQLMYRFYEKTGNEAAAFSYYRDHTALRDSLWKMEKMQLQNDLSRELKDKEQAGEIALLQKQNQLNNLYLWVTAGFIILSLAIIMLIYINYRRGRKNILKLKALNSRISDQKKQVEQTTQQLRQINLDKDRILHIVAHDLRNPVSASMMLASFIKESDVDDEQKENAEMIVGASESALALIAELLEYSGDNSKKGGVKQEPADLCALVKHCVGLLQFKAKEKRQQINLNLPTHPLIALINWDKMSRVIANLVTNAIKFSPEQTTIQVSAKCNNSNCVIEVKDNGIGIPEKLQPNVFEPFTAAQRFGTSGEKSFGLGLSICKQIVEAANGRIWFESIEGKGTTFYVELPIHQ